jgi:hypothetical protein
MASKSKQLISCMSKAKGDAKKIAACKSSFDESLKDEDLKADIMAPMNSLYQRAMLQAGQSDEDRVWGKFIRKGSLYNPTGKDSVILDSILREEMKK